MRPFPPPRMFELEATGRGQSAFRTADDDFSEPAHYEDNATKEPHAAYAMMEKLRKQTSMAIGESTKRWAWVAPHRGELERVQFSCSVAFSSCSR
eukprot:4070494-Prymnesium_polylepis.1